MKQRPILFSGPMVCAILDGRKTHTRRTNGLERVNLNPEARTSAHYVNDGYWDLTMHDGTWNGIIKCPYGQVGDQLWVRETYYAFGKWEKRWSEKKQKEVWHFLDFTIGEGLKYKYATNGKLETGKRQLGEAKWHKRPAIFMPRKASRITLEITGVRVERLNDCSKADAIAEGIESCDLVINGISEGGHYRDYKLNTDDVCEWFTNPIYSYQTLWEQINGAGSWDLNPWVWVVEFKAIKR